MSRIALAIALVAVISGTASARRVPERSAVAAPGSCRLVVEPPFLYAGTVIPVSSVECTGTVRRLRIITTLEKDGMEEASARRDCRNSSTCWLTVDAAAEDVPRDQVWCTSAVGYENGEPIGAATACEGAPF